MEINVFLFFILLFSPVILLRIYEDTHMIESTPQQRNDKKSSYASQQTDYVIPTFFSFNEAIRNNGLRLKGNSTFIKDSRKKEAHIFIQEGSHIIKDSRFQIKYIIDSHKKSDGFVNMFCHDITINGIPIAGKVTNKNSSAKILARMFEITNGDVMNNSEVGPFFLLFCSALLVHNLYNKNRILSHYKHMESDFLERMIFENSTIRENYENEIFQLLEQLLFYGSYNNSYNDSYNEASNQSTDFSIYLRILEFKSVHRVSLEDIKKQYRKLTKKYHPDVYGGDDTHFKLVTEAYDFLLENYQS